MNEDVKDSMGMRALKAVAVVMALLLMVPGIDAIARVTGGSAAYGAASGGIDSRALVQMDDPFAALDRVEGVADAEGAEVPEAFDREVGLLPGAQGLRVDATGDVVGYEVPGSAADASNRLAECMKERGWRAVSLGGLDGATFVKTSGELAWALATCTQVDDSTSVVVRCMRR
ncbi:MAG: hypothetical protein IJ087_01860 [Eggerthellaceae bacterium]|nr:hypothetical protein [Eggerthellaceae bacterium]